MDVYVYSVLLFYCAGQQNFIAVGVCDETYPKNLLPGWENTSIAFHTDEGSLFNCSDNAQPLNLPCGNGDVLKCSVVLSSERNNSVTIEFFRNGERIAQVPSDIPAGGFYGVVGMMSKGEKIQMSPPMVTKRTEFDQIWEVCTSHTIAHLGGGVCSYSGPGDFSEDSIGTVRSKTPINPLGPLSGRSFEIRIVNPGDQRYIAIGVVSEAYPRNLLPGWEETSVGYHADNGNLFHSCGDGQPTDHPCKEGDIMRCTVEPVDKSPKQVKVLFHRNGQLVGQVTAWPPSKGFYACFGMMSRREKLEVILPEVLVPYSPPKMQFDDVWEVLNPNLQHHGNGVCYYVGAGGSEHVGTIRSKLPVSAFMPNNSFEVKIVDPGEHCYIALGLCSKLYPANLLPGWEDISLGFHADDGLILQSSAGEQQTSHPCQRGDVVRCSVEPVDGSVKQVSVVFHRNGSFVGKAIVWTPKDGGFYAQVGCMSLGEVIQVASPQMEPSFLKPDITLAAEAQGGASMLPLTSSGQPMKMKQLSQGPTPSHPHPAEDEARYMTRFFEGPSGSTAMTTRAGVGGGRGSDLPGSVPVHPMEYRYPHLRYPHPPHPPHPPPHPYMFSPRFHPPFYHHHHPYDYIPPTDLSKYCPRRHHPYFSPSHHPGASAASSASSTSNPFNFHQHSVPLSDHQRPSSSSVSGGTTATPTSTLTAPPGYYHPRMYAEQVSVESIASEQGARLESQSSIESTTDSYASSGRSGSFQSGDLGSYNLSFIRTHTKPSSLSSYDSQTSLTESFGRSEMSTLEESTKPMKAEMATLDAQSGGKEVEYRAPSPFRPQAKEVEYRAPSPFQLPVKEVEYRAPSPFRPPVREEPVQVVRTGVLQTGSDYPDSPVTLSLQTETLEATVADTSASLETSFQMGLERNPVGLIPKEENRKFRILHNVNSSGDGSLECSLPANSSEVSFIMSRLPLTEKIPYFEVEVQLFQPSGNVAVGLVWNRYPPFQLPGMLHGSVAFYSADGAIHTSSVDCRVVVPLCTAGDVIGCKANLHYKSEVANPGSEGTIQVEFFRNGCPVGGESIPLPPSGLYPAVGLQGPGTKVKVNQELTLTPESYFQTHTLPENFSNFLLPPPVTEAWNCLQNAKIDKENVLSFLQPEAGKPSVVQSYLPFSKVSKYFEVELLHPLNSYSVFSLGVMPKAPPDLKQIIPGEARKSAGYLPLLGFVMRNGTICCHIPEAFTSAMKRTTEKITIGVGIDFHSTSDDSVRVFFTVNSQQVTSIVAVPFKDGLYPTLSVDSDFCSQVNHLASFHFPKLWPVAKGLPFGFIRGSNNGLVLRDPMTIVDAKGLELGSDDRTVRAIQAAFPLSPFHTYFEVRIIGTAPVFCVSCGLASYNYPLDIHPGTGKDSVAFHAHNGKVYHNSTEEDAAPISCYKGATLGCGVRFPEDGNMRYAEVFFTVNQKIVARKFVSVPQLGLFPTIGFRAGGGMITVDLNAPDPFPELRFCTLWGKDCDMKVEGCEVWLAPKSKQGSAQLAKPISTHELVYFKVTPLSQQTGKIMIGLSTEKNCSSSYNLVEDLRTFLFDINAGLVILHGEYFQSNETCAVESGHEFGCGLKPIPSSDKCLLFFTTNNQVVYCSEIDIQGWKIYPTIFMIESTTRLSLNACAIWPPMTPIGRGWAKYSNLLQENGMIVHTPTRLKSKIPVGFAQAAMPLTPSSPYFEIEICSSALDKAIAIGVAPRNYPTNTWIGWKPDSIAYHLDDGRLFKGNGYCGQKFGPKVLAGHTVGCGIRFGSIKHTSVLKTHESIEIFFTINGAICGTMKEKIPCGGFFPAICLESPTESVIFHFRSEYPPFCMSSEWRSSFSLHQAGRLLEHSCRHKELQGGTPRAFCQAREPFASERPYFEIEIVGVGGWSQIQAGAAAMIPHGCISLDVDFMLYSCAGQLVTKKGPQRSTNGTQKCGLGDRLGCAVFFDKGHPSAIEFYLNNMKVLHLDLLDRWQQHVLYPTIVLTHPGDAVIPALYLPLPKWDRSSLIGWLRSERVKLRGNIVEYTGSGVTTTDVGVAQVSQPLQLDSDSYYEIEIIDPGVKCTIAIGAAPADYPLNSQPGWIKNSIAYHGDDGQVFQANGFGSPFGPRWNPRDVIGLGIRSASESTSCDTGSEVQVYFTRNGDELGHVTVTIPTSGLFPTVGLHSSREKIKINHSATNPCNQEPTRLAWRVLCGLKISPSPIRDGSHILEYQNNGRKTPTPGIKIGLGIANEPFSESMQYFEVHILSFGHLRAIAVGAVPKDYSIEHAPGWSENSVGYHTDNGELYHSSGRGKVFGPVPREGDTVGCGVSLIPNNTKNCVIFFTYNGMEVGRVRTALPEGGLYPAVAPTSKKDKVSVMFMETFKPKISVSELHFVGLMRINNCSYSEQVIHFSGGGNSGYSQAPAMAQFSVPLHREYNHFAANIIKCEDTILIGLAVRDYPMKYAPGYTSVSIAYDITKGNVRAVYGSDNFHSFDAPKCKAGDTVGCGIDTATATDSKTDQSCVFFTKNGTIVRKVKLVEIFEELYPIVGIVPKGRSSALFMDWNTPIFEPKNVL